MSDGSSGKKQRVSSPMRAGHTGSAAAAADASAAPGSPGMPATPPRPPGAAPALMSPSIGGVLPTWEDMVVADVFQFCLTERVEKVRNGAVSRAVDLEEELARESPGTPFSIVTDRSFVDRLVVSRLSSASLGAPPLEYMVACYERAQKLFAAGAPPGRPRGMTPEDCKRARSTALEHVCDVLLSYMVLTLATPGMWGGDAGADAASLVALLGGRQLPAALLGELVTRIEKGDAGVTLEDVFAPVVECVFGTLDAMTPKKAPPNFLAFLGNAAPAAPAGRPGINPGGDVGKWLDALAALERLTAAKPLCAVVVGHARWAPPASAQADGAALETGSLLGVAASLGPTREAFVLSDGTDMCAEVAGWERNHFHPSTQRELAQLTGVHAAVRKSLAAAHLTLNAVVKNLCRVPAAREATFALLGRVCDANTARTNEGFHHGFQQAKATSSEGMLHALANAMLTMCEPFFDVHAEKAAKHAAKVDLWYTLTEARFPLGDEARLALSSDTLAAIQKDAPPEAEAAAAAAAAAAPTDAAAPRIDRWLDVRNASRIEQFAAAQGLDAAMLQDLRARWTAHAAEAAKAAPFGTVSEYFGLASRLVHVGAVQAMVGYKDGIKQLQHAARHMNEMREEVNAPGQANAMQLQAALANIAGKVETMIFKRLSTESLLMDKDQGQRLTRFMRLQSALLARSAAGGQAKPGGGTPHDFVVASLPLPALTLPFAILPEHLLGDLAEVVQFYLTQAHSAGTGMPLIDELLLHGEASDVLTALVVFTSSALHVRNPYVRAKLVETLSAFKPDSAEDVERQHGRRRSPPGSAAGLFDTHPLAVAHLPGNLLQFFVDCEHTGAHTGFYDKFQFRHTAGALFEHMWTVPAYVDSICAAAKDEARFTKFVNMLINDIIHHMDEAIEALGKVREYQQKVADAAAWAAVGAEEQAAQEGTANQEMGQARAWLMYAARMLTLMANLSERIVAEFLVESMIDRIAQMLNYFIDHLVGPKSMQLKVSDQEGMKATWEPDKVLVKLVTIYAHFAAFDGFAQSVARDDRSYRPAYFSKAAEVLRRPKIANSFPAAARNIAAFERFAKAVAACEQSNAVDEAELGDVPESFKDPITDAVMVEPVKFPSSGTIVDKATALRCLMNDPMDPYNRKPCTPDMLLPLPEVKAMIDAWRAWKKGGEVGDEPSSEVPDDVGERAAGGVEAMSLDA